jgi:serine/threonine protein kinase
MALASGTRLGPYEISGSLGAGGMGEVYRATDTRLNRPVAVKVLPADIATDPEFRARFRREAQAIAALSHPNVCVLHDVGQDGAHDFLVMELLEGETLAERLRRGPLPGDQVIRYGIQIAEALWAAHRRGVVHRDLKPGNVMMTPSGIKVLDFGLAKSLGQEVAQGAAALTKSIPVTVRGTVMGTPGYIAPEQLLGDPADARSDIFALGAVLFEMATGGRAFSGTSQAQVVASVLEEDPVSTWNGATSAPPLLRRVVAKCLAKNPDERWQSASDVAEALRWAAEERNSVPAMGALSRHKWTWALVGAAAAAAIAAALFLFGNQQDPEPPLRASIVPAPGTNFTPRDITGTPHFALSPDGQSIVFVANAPGEVPRLWLRSLSAVDPRPLPGTEDAGGPFWSPDSTQVAFFSRRKLKRLSIAGGSVQELAEISFDVTGGTWNPDGTIIFGGPTSEGLYRIAATGGALDLATTLQPKRGETGHRWPRFLPDGRSFLFFVRSTQADVSGIYVTEAGSNTRKQILPSRASATFVEPAFLLSDRNGTLMVYDFDPVAKEIRGEPVPLDDRLTAQIGPSHLPLDASRNGTLAYWNGLGPVSRLEWYDRSGRLLRQTGEQGHQFSPDLSADGRKMLITRRPAPTNNELWSVDLETGEWSRVTFAPGGSRFGLWSNDSQRIVYSSLGPDASRLYERAASGAGRDRVFFDPGHWAVFPLDWSADGKWLIYAATTATAWDVGALNVQDGSRRPLLNTGSNEVQGQLSPDDRWLAYASDESGTWEVYVTTFPDGTGKWQVSNKGGSQPRWSADGRELFFLSDDGTLMSAAVKPGNVFAAAQPRPLFRSRAWRNLTPFRTSYAVAPNGEFLISAVVSEAVEPITIVHNWTAAMPRR